MWPFTKGNQQYDQGGTRHVHANDPEANMHFPPNVISNTKYTVWNFVFKNLLEQFSRFMNCYFLMIGCLQLWGEITPVAPITTLLPLAVIFTMSATKEAVDDYFRYKSDKQANSCPATVYRDGVGLQVESADIRVGDIVHLTAGDTEIPADMVLLSSSEENGVCYIQTANLDGESDLKTRRALPATAGLRPAEVRPFRGSVECATPNAHIYQFDSVLKIGSESYALSSEQLLLQATHLRNTEWALGLVVYTGNETKVGQNKRVPPTKWTKVDRYINKMTVFIFALQLSLVVTLGVIGDVTKSKKFEQVWYLAYPSDEKWYQPAIIPLRYLLLCSLMIPISLKVFLDLCKGAYALFIVWDKQMYDEERDIRAVANSTAISEDLGQVEYILSDKTGTLTENIMQFRKCVIDGVTYDVSPDNPEGLQLLSKCITSSESGGWFARNLALCNTVTPLPAEGDSHKFQASSPDEEALVSGMAGVGMVLKSRDLKHASLISPDSDAEEAYDILAILEFTSDRKRMSTVIRRRDTGKLLLLSKGADDVILPRLVADAPHLESTKDTLSSFARLGLRTLCIAQRELTEEEFTSWAENLDSASKELQNRELKVAAVYDKLERDLTLLGATAIEDKLQDSVPETIQTLRDAGIRFWMLTGDKQETAVQIALSSRLISSDPNAELLDLRGSSESEVLSCLAQLSRDRDHDTKGRQLGRRRSHDSEITANEREVSLVVTGPALHWALTRDPDTFRKVALACDTVICCRVTPDHKAEVVRMVKEAGALTLAVGDGGNDVAMIQEAHVGVGIRGREGMQASRASDYSVAKFKFIKRLILIHGHYSVHRSCFLAQYSFYKSLIIAFVQLTYGFYCGFSGTTFFNTFSITTYNVIFTGLPVFMYALQDKNLPEEVLLRHPELYRESQKGTYMTWKTMAVWVGWALFQGVLLCTMSLAIYSNDHLARHGFPEDYQSTPMMAFTALVVLQTLTVAVETNSFTWLNHLAIWWTLGGFIVMLVVVNSIIRFGMYYIVFHLFQSVKYWCAVLIVTTVTLGPFVLVKYYNLMFRRTPIQHMQVLEHARKTLMRETRAAGVDAGQEHLLSMVRLGVDV